MENSVWFFSNTSKSDFKFFADRLVSLKVITVEFIATRIIHSLFVELSYLEFQWNGSGKVLGTSVEGHNFWPIKVCVRVLCAVLSYT